MHDPVIKAWWAGYFDLLDRRLQIEISNPVQTKVQRFAGSRAARAIVGQARSTIDPAAWIRSGAVIIINTAKGAVGEDTAALVGATLLNLTALAIGDQAELDVRQRRPVTLLVDGFHTMPGADYEAILSELAKYGASLVLATQSLARLEALDREQHRALRSTVFANLDGLFAFHTSAEDAQYLVRELGDEIDEQDLISLGEHQCYVKLSAGGQRLPTFSVRLDPPPLSDPVVGDGLAAASAALYGREWTRVENDLNSALQRIELSHRMPQDGGLAGEGGTGVARDVAGRTDPQGGRRADERQERNDQRRQRPNRTQTHQGTLFNTLAMSEGASDVAPLPADVDSHAHMDAGEPLV